MPTDRRKFLKQAGIVTAGSGALWVTPSVLGLDKAFAAGSCVPPVLTSAASWTSNTTFINWQGAGSGNLGPFSAPLPTPYNTAPFDPAVTGGTVVPIYLVEQDPAAGTYAYTTVAATYTSTGFALAAGRTYTFTFNIRWRDTTNHVATQQVLVQSATNAAGPWTTRSTFDTTLGTGTRDNLHDVTPQPGFSLPITVATAGTYFFRYAFSFQGTVSTANNMRANDLAITLPTASCV